MNPNYSRPRVIKPVKQDSSLNVYDLLGEDKSRSKADEVTSVGKERIRIPRERYLEMPVGVGWRPLCELLFDEMDWHTGRSCDGVLVEEEEEE